jgi:hypothetical protein
MQIEIDETDAKNILGMIQNTYTSGNVRSREASDALEALKAKVAKAVEAAKLGKGE